MKRSTVALFTICVFAFISCNTSTTDNPTPDTDGPVEIKPADNEFWVKEKAAVLLNIDSIETQEIIDNNPEDVLAEIFSDIGYYRAEATDRLTALGVNVLSTDKEIVVFQQPNGDTVQIERKKVESDLMFFTPGKAPVGTFTSYFDKELPALELGEENLPFQEAYWVDDKIAERMGTEHVHEYFYKTSFINDEPLFQIFNSSNIDEEEILAEQADGTYKHPKKEQFFRFRVDGDKLKVTITQEGTVKEYVQVGIAQIKE